MLKKTLILFFLALTLSYCFSQVPNNDFEQWISNSQEQLLHWDIGGLISAETNSNTGNYALKLEQNPINYGAALVLHGDYIDGIGFIGGVPYSERPDSVKGYYKCYSPEPEDAAIILVYFRKNGVSISEDMFVLPQTPDTLSFHEFKFEINYQNAETPDSVIILITSPNAFQTDYYSGYMIIDDISFTNATQEIPNGNFENWSIISWDEPYQWMTTNHTGIESGNFPVQRTLDSYSGDYAAKIQNFVSETDTILGLMLSSETGSFGSGATIIDDYYTSFSGHYKYYPENGDNMMVFVFLYKNDTMVGNAVFANSVETPEYTKFDIPIHYFNGLFDIADSAVFYAMPGDYSNPQGNSVLYLDNLQLVKNTDIYINEIVSSNTSTFFDFQNDAEDWIELYNAGSSPVLLNNFFISDNEAVPDKWRIPQHLIEPNSFLVIFASGKDLFWPHAHTNFSLSSSGEPVLLSLPTGELIDHVAAVELPTNISWGRYPDASDNFMFFAEPTPLKSNTLSDPYSGFSDLAVEFSHQGGFYSEPISLSMYCSHPFASIHYTLDGTVPNLNSPIYSEPILIESREGDPNIFSEIQTTHDIFWTSPVSEVFKATPVRAKAFVTDAISLNTESHTFFVDENIYNRYNLPVWSLITDTINLYNFEKGIFIAGKTYHDYAEAHPEDTSVVFRPANFFNRGQAWERDVHIEFFENSNSEIALRQDAGVRLHGGVSRLWKQKSLRLYSRDAYSEEYFNYPIIPGNKKMSTQQNLDKYKRFTLRASGNDYEHTLFRDGMIHSLVNHTQVDIQAFQPSVVFINGEYWGIHNIRERQDKYYLNSHYNIPEEDVVIVETMGFLNTGEDGDELHFHALNEFASNNDLSDSVNMLLISTLMDIDNFLDYQIIQIYINNQDWPGNNIKYWRERTEDYITHAAPGRDGRWRWLLYDTDFGFGLYDGFDAVLYNSLAFATAEGLEEWPNPDWSTLLLRKLLDNEGFKNDFINRMADHVNTSFKPERVLEVIESIRNMILPYMPEHFDRWHDAAPISNWHNRIEIMEYFAINRPPHVAQHFIDRWSLSGMSNVVLNVSDTEHGKIKISSIVIDENTVGANSGVYPWTGKYYNDIPIPIRAIAKPGYQFVKWEETDETDELINVTLNGPINLTAIFEQDPDYGGQALYINEFMASNSITIADEFENFEDWIEIYNSSNETIDLAGYYISDNFSNPHKHRFSFASDETKIHPGGFLLLWADNEPEKGALHLSFKLSANGEQIVLTEPDGLTIVDSISFGNQTTDISYGRYPDANENWIFFNQPTPGESNIISYVNEHNISEQYIVIYPNPARDYLNVNPAADIRIYNVNGKIKIEKNMADFVDVSNLKKGLYFILINNKRAEKLIIY